MKSIVIFLALFASPIAAFTQVSISPDNSPPDSSAILHIQSADRGLLIPRMDSTQRMNIIDPAPGLMVFDTSTMSFWYYVNAWIEGLGKDDEDWEKNASGVYNNLGRVSIGTNHALATLHLSDTSNVLIGDSLSGSGFKAIYYANKGAFRCGYLSNPFSGYNFNRFWDYDSVGYYSWAGGRNSRAKGIGAFAFGSFGWADGSGSVAFFGNAKGNNSFTFGGSSKGRGSITFEGTADEEGGIAMYGHTEGRYGVSIGGGTSGLGASRAREDYSVAIGWYADARGQASIALGPSDAYGFNALSTGWVTEARGNYSSTFGYRTISFPYASMALGRYNTVSGDSASWVATDPVFIIGDGTNSSNRSNSFMIQKNGQTAIGYNTPTGMLNVSTALGSISGGGNTINFDNAAFLIGTTSSGIAFDANQVESVGSTMFFNFNSTEDIALASGGGNVGVGTSAPEHPLHIVKTGTIGQPTIALVLESNNSNRPLLLFSENTSNVGLEDGMSLEYDGAVSGNKFYINGVNGIPRFTVENLGDVGIGTTSPNRELTVFDTDDDGDAVINLKASNSSDREMLLAVSQGSGGIVGMVTNNDLFFRTNNSNRLVIENNGDVGIGTTNPTALLEVNASTVKKVGGGSWSSTSDRRLKQSVREYKEGLSEVMQIRPVKYQYNEKSGHDTSSEHIGVIAQELEKIAPYMVGTYEKDGEEYLQVDNSAMTYMLINAVKEQQAVIDQNQDDIKLLKQKVEDLQNLITHQLLPEHSKN